jgi:hypothetical protein
LRLSRAVLIGMRSPLFPAMPPFYDEPDPLP